MIKVTKYAFFDNKIQKIVSKNYKPWNLMDWVKKWKLPAIEAVQYNRYPCTKIEDF